MELLKYQKQNSFCGSGSASLSMSELPPEPQTQRPTPCLMLDGRSASPPGSVGPRLQPPHVPYASVCHKHG